MGEEVPPFKLEFNGSIRVEARDERLSEGAGAVLLREVLERLELMPWLTERLEDPRNPDLVTHTLPELLRTALLLLCLGWKDLNDANTLRFDGALRLAVSGRKGVSPLEEEEGAAPQGLPSQPTLSRMAQSLALAANREVLKHGLVEMSARRIRASRGGHRMRYVTVDVDSLPIEVHGHQPGSEYNGHYNQRIYHPLIASAAETGDLLDARLRAGNAHTADGALDFILPLLTRVEQSICQVAAVRMDAGFPEEALLAGLETRGTPYVARLKNNKALDRMALPHLSRPPGRPPAEPRTWLHEMTYQAASWSRPRRVVLVVQERKEDLFLHHFWLITSWAPSQVSAEELLAMYRERGAAEGYMGELMNALSPSLSSSPRPKSHYRGAVPEKRSEPVDAFALNEVRLLLAVMAYNLAHAARTLMAAATGEPWSIKRLQERVLRVATRILVHGRRIVLVLGLSARHWRTLWRKLRLFHVTEARAPT
jgi:hypothetical protein